MPLDDLHARVAVFLPVACRGRARRVDQQIGDATHRGSDDDQILILRRLICHDGHDLADCLRVIDGRAAKLQNLHCAPPWL
jgi:hypothetical protein